MKRERARQAVRAGAGQRPFGRHPVEIVLAGIRSHVRICGPHLALISNISKIPFSSIHPSSSELIVGSSLIGHWLAKAWRATDYGWKFGVILFAMLASAVVVYLGWPPRLGVDLGGGTILVYKVDERDRVAARKDGFAAGLDRKRVNPGGQKEISVRSLGTDMVEIVIPE